MRLLAYHTGRHPAFCQHVGLRSSRIGSKYERLLSLGGTVSDEGGGVSDKKQEQPDNVDGLKLVRRILEMVGILHRRGYESLYIYPHMAGHGGSWRFHLGVMEDGAWPAPDSKRLVFGWVVGGPDYALEWVAGAGTDDPATLADKFIARYGEALAFARVQNPPYVAWYREMLERSGPGDIVTFWCSGIEDYEYVFTWNKSSFRMPMPPGFDPKRL